jgi:hypothetical protein
MIQGSGNLGIGKKAGVKYLCFGNFLPCAQGFEFRIGQNGYYAKFPVGQGF